MTTYVYAQTETAAVTWANLARIPIAERRIYGPDHGQRTGDKRQPGDRIVFVGAIPLDVQRNVERSRRKTRTAPEIEHLQLSTTR
jgi:hypothetical protein